MRNTLLLFLLLVMICNCALYLMNEHGGQERPYPAPASSSSATEKRKYKIKNKDMVSLVAGIASYVCRTFFLDRDFLLVFAYGTVVLSHRPIFIFRSL
jgi:hypothetical protein